MTDNSKNILSILGIFTVVAAVYMPVYTGYYAFWDDYYLLGGELFSGKVVYSLFKLQARPLASLLFSWLGSMVSLEQANTVRFVHVLSVGVMASIFFSWLRKSSQSLVNSLLLAIVVFTLPPFQVVVSLITVGLVVMPAALAAACAALAASRASMRTPARRAFLNVYSLGALLFLAASLSTYQSAGMFYWTMLAVPLLFAAGGEGIRLRRAVHLFAVPFAAMGAYYLLGRIFTAGAPRAASYYVYGLTTDPVAKMKWFLSQPMGDALAPWSIFHSTHFIYISLALIIAGAVAAVAAAIRDKGKEGFIRSMPVLGLRCLLVLSLLPLSFLPNIASKGEFAPYRTMIALVPLVVLALYWALRSLARILPARAGGVLVTAVLAAAALGGAYMAHYNVKHYFAGPSTAEARFIKDALLKGDLRNFDSVMLVYPEQSLVLGRYRLDEFGALTSSSKAHRVPLMATVIQSIPESRRGGPINLLFASEEEFKGAGDRTLVIDLTWMHGKYLEAPDQKFR